jgi:hypothetical protein
MELTKLGWNADLSHQFAPHHTKGLVPARVAVEDKRFFRVWTADAELLAQVSGKCIKKDLSRPTGQTRLCPRCEAHIQQLSAGF